MKSGQNYRTSFFVLGYQNGRIEYKTDIHIMYYFIDLCMYNPNTMQYD